MTFWKLAWQINPSDFDYVSNCSFLWTFFCFNAPLYLKFIIRWLMFELIFAILSCVKLEVCTWRHITNTDDLIGNGVTCMAMEWCTKTTAPTIHTHTQHQQQPLYRQQNGSGKQRREIRTRKMKCEKQHYDL